MEQREERVHSKIEGTDEGEEAGVRG